MPNDLSRSSCGNSRLAGIVGRFGINPGRNHWLLFGPAPISARGAGKFGLSAGGYIGGGLGAMGVLSAFGPVGIFAGKLFGEVLTANAPPLADLMEEFEGVTVPEFSLGV